MQGTGIFKKWKFAHAKLDGTGELSPPCFVLVVKEVQGRSEERTSRMEKIEIIQNGPYVACTSRAPPLLAVAAFGCILSYAAHLPSTWAGCAGTFKVFKTPRDRNPMVMMKAVDVATGADAARKAA